jgi:tetratricopeptide (TPR) repeat protein
MAIKGSLREASLADVVQLLALGMKSGCLSVADRSRLGQIFFDRGRITYARIVNRRDRLGDLLVRDGVLRAEQLQEALETQAHEPDARVGELLVARGLISQDVLNRYIGIQIEEAVFHLFTWTRGTFFFEAGERPAAGEATVSINPESLLLEAARRVDEWSLIEKKIPSLDHIFDVDPERLSAIEVELTPEQQKLIPLLDGTRTVNDLIDKTGLTEIDAGKALFGLVQAGFARSAGHRAPGTERTADTEAAERRNLAAAFYRAGMLDDAAREFTQLLQLCPDDLLASHYLALIHLRERRLGDATEAWKRLLERHGPRFSAFLNFAVALRMSGRGTDATLVLDAAESLQPDSPLPALGRGMQHLLAYRTAEALRHFDEYRRKLRSDENPAVVYFYYAGLAAALAGDLDHAEGLVREGLRTHPRAAPLLLLGGLISERRGEWEGAERLYRRALESDSTLVQAHKNLGDLAYRRGAYDEAMPMYQRVAELAPELGEDVYVKLGNLHYKSRNRDGAIRYWTRALELNPHNQVVRNNLEIVAHAAG